VKYADPVRVAERSLVGMTLHDVRCFTDSCLVPEQFYDPNLQSIWRTIGQLESEGKFTDAIVVADRLEPRVDMKFLADLAADAPMHSHVQPYVDVIRESWLKRGCRLAGSELRAMDARGCSGAEMLTHLQSKLNELELSDNRAFLTMGDHVEQEQQAIVRDLKNKREGKPTVYGLASGLGLERVCPGGIPIDKVTTLFGESGNYKTTFKNNLVWGIASNGHHILDISYEDTDRLTTQRWLASQTGLGYGAIATRQISETGEKQILEIAPSALETANRVILAGELLPDIDEVIRTARYYKRTRNVTAVVIDYIQLLGSEKKELDYTMRQAQLSAKRDRLAYIFISQVKQDVDARAIEKPRDRRPKISDMIGSSFMRFAPKLSIGIYRPALYEPVPKKHSEYYDFYTQNPEGPKIYPNIIELWMVKNVLGEPGVCIHCLVEPKTGKMIPMDKGILG